MFLTIVLAIPAGLFLTAGIANFLSDLRDWRFGRRVNRALRAMRVAEEKAAMDRRSANAKKWFETHESQPAFVEHEGSDLPLWYLLGFLLFCVIGLFI